MTKPRSLPRPRRIWGAAALVAGAALILAACSSGTTSGTPVGGGSSTGQSNASSSPGASSASSSAAAATKPVHVGLNIGDGGQVGVGMPVIATFKTKVTDAKAFQAATKLTVNDQPATGAWYFEYSDPASGHVMEAHYRMQHYWPAHSRIHIDIPVKGLSAGNGLSFDDSLTLDFLTGAANVAVVSDISHTLTLTTDGNAVGTYPVSLGAADTRTLSGIKVIMEKGASICMHGPGYNECGIKDDQRLTYGGEYLHSAPWNVSNIEHGVDSSNGCTNLLPADAAKLYGILEIGDVVQYPDANGGKMQIGQGYGDWNVPWALWQSGGAVATS